MPSFDTGLSALNVSQRALDLIGQNLANVNTPGYHRQVTLLASRAVEGTVGNGVEVSQVRRPSSSILDSAVLNSTSDANALSAQLDTTRQIESLFTPGDGSINSLVDKFFDQLTQLAARPDDLAQRRVVLNGAVGLTDQFNALASNLDQLRSNADAQVQQQVGQINTLAPQIAKLNEQIQRVEAQGLEANDLHDQRDQLIHQLAGIVNVQTVEQPLGQTNVLVDGAALVVGNQASSLASAVDPNNNLIVTAAGSNVPLNLTGGTLAGLLQVRNQVLPSFHGRLDTLARTLAQKVDGVQATGLGLTGPLTRAVGDRPVSKTSVPLAQANLAFPAQAGSLFLSVTNLATGQRTLSEVAINPTTQSLQDVATALGGVSHVQGLVDPQTRTLQVIAQQGYAFDFAGRLASTPDSTAITGTTTAQVGGVYTGSTNDVLTYRVLGSGTVGVTPNLTLEVRNSAGNPVASLNIGQGYEPGKPLALGNGVTVQLTAGTANAGDTFTTRVVAQPDTAGLLPALGLNTFFSGTDASTLAVRPELTSSPDQLAASRTGQPSDGTNLSKMAALRDAPLLAGGTQTLSQSAADLVGDVGTRVQDLSQRQDAQQALGQHLEAERQSVSGVDPNEELVHMLQFQKSFQAAARFISVVNQTLDDLFHMVS